MKNTTYSANPFGHATGSVEFPRVGDLISSLRRAVARYKSAMEQRRLRHEFAELDPMLLRDIGIAEDEIARVRAREPFMPRAWQI